MAAKKYLIVLILLFHISGYSQSDTTKWQKEVNTGVSFVSIQWSDKNFSDKVLPRPNFSYSLTRNIRSHFGFKSRIGVTGFAYITNRHDIQEYDQGTGTLIILGERFVRNTDRFYYVASGLCYHTSLKRMNFRMSFTPAFYLLHVDRRYGIEDYISRYPAETYYSVDWEYYLRAGFIAELSLTYRVKNNWSIGLNYGLINIIEERHPKMYYFVHEFNFQIRKDFELKVKNLGERNAKRNIVYAELLGSSFLYSVNYERKLNRNAVWNIYGRMGTAYLFGPHFNIGFNLSLGKNVPKFEISCTNTTAFFVNNPAEHFLFPSLGFRRETPRDWFMRLQIGPVFHYDQYDIELWYILPGFSFGKKF